MTAPMMAPIGFLVKEAAVDGELVGLVELAAPDVEVAATPCGGKLDAAPISSLSVVYTA